MAKENDPSTMAKENDPSTMTEGKRPFHHGEEIIS